MKLSHILLTSLTEWLSENALAVIGLIVAWLASVGGMVWKISQAVSASEANGVKVEALAKAFAEHADDLDEHRRDSSVHTTFEQRQAINAKFDRMEDGHNRIENKIDRLTEIMLKK